MKEIKLGGVTFFGSTSEEVIGKVKDHFPDEDLDEIFLVSLVKEKKSLGTALKERIFSFFVKDVTFNDALVGAEAIVTNFAGGTVSQEEINRRSLICQRCPLVSDVTNCMSCGGSSTVYNWVNSFKKKVGMGAEFPNGIEKKFCGFCSCSLAVKIPTKLSCIAKSSKGITEKRPENCWLNPNSQNFKDEA
jgi:hypothetical protein